MAAHPDSQCHPSVLRVQGLAQRDADLAKRALALRENLSQKLRCKALHTDQHMSST